MVNGKKSILKEEQDYLKKVTSILENKIESYSDRKNDIYIVDNEDRIAWIQMQESIKYGQKIASEYREIKEEPYFGKLNCEVIYYRKDGDVIKEESIYIGKHGIFENGEVLVVDWRTPVGQYYYARQNYNFIYKADNNEDETEYTIRLKRALDIRNATLYGYDDLYNEIDEFVNESITDEVLRKIIAEKRNDPILTDIIKTIQENQSGIINYPLNESFIVQGCAGSGKTMVLLHRLSFLLFNNKSLIPSSIKIITPNSNFNLFINQLSHELGLDNIEKMDVAHYYIHLLKKYNSLPNKIGNDITDKNLNSDYLKEIYSRNFYLNISSKFDEYIAEKIHQIESDNLYDKLKVINFNPTFKLKELKDVKNFSELLIKFFQNLSSVLIKKSNTLSQIEDELFQLTKVRKNLSSEEVKKINIIINRYFDIYKPAIKTKSNVDIDYEIKKNEINDSLENEYKIYISWFSDNKNKEILHLKNLKEKLKNSKGLQLLLFRNRYINKITKIEEKIETNDKFYNSYQVLKEQKNEELLNYKNERIKKSNETIFNYNNDLISELNISIENVGIDQKFNSIKRLLDDYNKYEQQNISPDMADYLKEKQNIIQSITSIDFFNTSITSIIDSLAKIHNINKNYFDFKWYYYLHLISAYLVNGELKLHDSYIHIDEGQDLSISEYQLIQIVNSGKAIFNIYGDLNQKINSYGITDWKDIKFIDNLFLLEENYRNTFEINQFCNYIMNSKTLTFGVFGEDVSFVDKDSLEHIIIKIRNSDKKRKAIILANTNSKHIQLLGNINIAHAKIDKLSYYTVEEAKGLEFEIVIVLTEGMSKNEKYIAFTRALSKLYVYGDDNERISIDFVTKNKESYRKELEKIALESRKKYLEEKRKQREEVQRSERQKHQLKIRQIEEEKGKILSLKRNFSQWIQTANKRNFILSSIHKCEVSNIVYHNDFGYGLIISIEKRIDAVDLLNVYFPTYGEKKFLSDTKLLHIVNNTGLLNNKITLYK